MREPRTASLLVGYFDAFRRDQDIDAFHRKVAARYTEGTLARLAQSGDAACRRAAILALGLSGSFAVNPVVARALRDPDAGVRSLAHSALWAIWFRADSPENNRALEEVHDLVNRQQLAEAIEKANRLIARAPRFAEAYNQRAIAFFLLGRYPVSVADCLQVLERNPYHIGALSGLGQCYLRLNQPRLALETFRRALKLQPYDAALRATVKALEADTGEGQRR